MGSKKKVKGTAVPTTPPADDIPGKDAGDDVEHVPREPRGLSFEIRTRVETLVALVVAMGFFQWLQSLTPHVVAVDAYFHQKMAVLMRMQGPVKDFYWTTTSTFKD